MHIIITLLFKTTLTVTTSNSSGEGMRELDNKDLMAIRTPPPLDFLSLRYSRKSDGRISLSNVEFVSQVSVIQYNV